MKIIFEDRISEISSDSEQANYPIENALDDHSKKVWKSDSGTITTVTLKTESNDLVTTHGKNGIALINLSNCYDVTVIIQDDESTAYVFDTYTNFGYGRVFIDNVFLEYDRADGDSIGEHTVILEFNGFSSAKPQCGRIYAGFSYTFPDPKTFTTTKEDESIIVDLDNGFEYTFKRNQVNTPDFEIQIPMDGTYDENDFKGFVRLADESIPNPIVVKLDGPPGYIDSTYSKYLMYYGRLREPCRVNIPDQFQYNIGFGLKEVL
jgi:hypothetical protein